MNKVHINLTVPSEMVGCAKARNINMSREFEKALRNILSLEEIMEDEKTLSGKARDAITLMSEHQLRRCKEEISQAPNLAGKWVKLIKAITGLKLTEKEVVEAFGKKE